MQREGWITYLWDLQCDLATAIRLFALLVFGVLGEWSYS